MCVYIYIYIYPLAPQVQRVTSLAERFAPDNEWCPTIYTNTNYYTNYTFTV